MIVLEPTFCKGGPDRCVHTVVVALPNGAGKEQPLDSRPVPRKFLVETLQLTA